MNGNEAVLPQVLQSSSLAYKGNGIIFGAILARMSLFSEATFAFQSFRDGSLNGAFTMDGRQNTSLRILENPWANGTTGELLCRMIQDADLAGNAYIWNTGTRLVRLRPDWVTIISELKYDFLGREYREVIGYYYEPPEMQRDVEGHPHLFLVDEIVHWSPIPDPEATFRGMSWMTPVAREIMADYGMTEYKIKYLENAASPNLLVRYAARLGTESVKRVRNLIDSRHSGTENAFKTLVLDEGADVTVIGNSMEQMNFTTVQAAGENRILIASGVPGIVVGSKEGLSAATYSNYEQALRRFADITMRPLWRSACAALSKFVKVPVDCRLWYNTTEIAALRQGEKDRAETLYVLSQAAKQLVDAGFERESVVKALQANDMNLLKVDEQVHAAALTPASAGQAPPVLNGTQHAAQANGIPKSLIGANND